MRRKRHEEHVNHEAWAIPYADLMTLLLAFFVVMYAVSVVNAGKYRVLSQSMADAFNGHAAVTAPATPAAVVKPPLPLRSPASSVVPLPSGSLAVPPHPLSAAPTPESAAKAVALQHIEDQVQRAMQPLIDKKLVILRRTPSQLEIEIRTDILYSSGAAQLSASANHALLSLASILARFPNALRVEGFTDNLPIRTTQYP
ncbi:MAG: flagellar motor protein MotB, partial [Rhodanobacter sp.]|nr:flagellar motor protein MotB [Rhodanobacter sp.]